MKKDTLQEFCQISGIDWTATLDRFMNNENLYEKILLKFPNDPSFHELKEKIAEGDAQASFMYAHTLKGVAGNLGLTRLFQLASQLTDELRNGHIENASPLMKDLTEQYEAICDFIKKIKN